jgi:hypothetical protein
MYEECGLFSSNSRFKFIYFFYFLILRIFLIYLRWFFCRYNNFLYVLFDNTTAVNAAYSLSIALDPVGTFAPSSVSFNTGMDTTYTFSFTTSYFYIKQIIIISICSLTFFPPTLVWHLLVYSLSFFYFHLQTINWFTMEVFKLIIMNPHNISVYGESRWLDEQIYKKYLKLKT